MKGKDAIRTIGNFCRVALVICGTDSGSRVARSGELLLLPFLQIIIATKAQQ